MCHHLDQTKSHTTPEACFRRTCAETMLAGIQGSSDQGISHAAAFTWGSPDELVGSKAQGLTLKSYAARPDKQHVTESVG